MTSAFQCFYHAFPRCPLNARSFFHRVRGSRIELRGVCECSLLSFLSLPPLLPPFAMVNSFSQKLISVFPKSSTSSGRCNGAVVTRNIFSACFGRSPQIEWDFQATEGTATQETTIFSDNSQTVESQAEGRVNKALSQFGRLQRKKKNPTEFDGDLNIINISISNKIMIGHLQCPCTGNIITVSRTLTLSLYDLKKNFEQFRMIA
ncbi:hypothetical protein J3R30DRAFT_951931 [Lentinula aciculospora]|uniref:Uncharacterized protein n=1 Tax=Lentinula aciculospora TaxID=153920 RepID=A0A9W9ASP4_9AGAR|nr:hypothetical protein J3R30DRAFT_951931 [Lentinula aciculospora]